MPAKSRFDHAIKSLYEGFYNGNLHPEDACRCAVGTICDGWSAWKHFSNDHGALKLNYVGKVHEGLGRRYFGFLPSELLRIEAAFLKGCGYELPLDHRRFRPEDPSDPEVQFKGLCAAIAVLCNLEGRADILPHTMAFDSLLQQKKVKLQSA